MYLCLLVLKKKIKNLKNKSPESIQMITGGGYYTGPQLKGDAASDYIHSLLRSVSGWCALKRGGPARTWP